jgi:hypothetical protein
VFATGTVPANTPGMTRHSSPAGRQAENPSAGEPEATDRTVGQYVPGGDLPLHSALPDEGCPVTNDPLDESGDAGDAYVPL